MRNRAILEYAQFLVVMVLVIQNLHKGTITITTNTNYSISGGGTDADIGIGDASKLQSQRNEIDELPKQTQEHRESDGSILSDSRERFLSAGSDGSPQDVVNTANALSSSSASLDNMKKANNSLAIFYNVFIPNEDSKIEPAIAIVEDQINQLGFASGRSVYPKVTLYFNTIGHASALHRSVLDPLCTRNSLECIHMQHYDQAFEEVTLQRLYDYCQQHEAERVVYLHSKGTYHPSIEQDQWRQYMTSSVMEKDCLNPPDDTCDACGLLFQPIPYIHFPGNIWTAKCAYVNKLIPPKDFGEVSAASRPYFHPDSWNRKGNHTGWHAWLMNPLDNPLGVGRFAMESWLGSHPTLRACDLAKTTVTSDEHEDLEWKMAPRHPLMGVVWRPLNVQQMNQYRSDRRGRLREFYLLVGQIHKWYSFYNETPPSDSWAWKWYPDGLTWQNAVDLFQSPAAIDYVLNHTALYQNTKREMRLMRKSQEGTGNEEGLEGIANVRPFDGDHHWRSRDNSPSTMTSSSMGDDAICHFKIRRRSASLRVDSAMESIYRCISFWRSMGALPLPSVSNRGRHRSPVMLYPDGHPEWPPSAGKKEQIAFLRNQAQQPISFYQGMLLSLLEVFDVSFVTQVPTGTPVAQPVLFDKSKSWEKFRLRSTDDVRVLGEGIRAFYNLGRQNNDPLVATEDRTCRAPRIAILNRRSGRRIMNAESLAHRLEKQLLQPLRDGNDGDVSTVPIVQLNNASFYEHVEFFHSVDIIISPHGKQLAGISFMPRCGGLIELLTPAYDIPRYFGSLATTSNLEYMALHVAGHALESNPSADLLPDEDLLLEAVQAMKESWQQCCLMDSTSLSQ